MRRPCLRLGGECLPPARTAAARTHLHSCSACPLLRSDDAESEKQRRKDLVRAAGRAAVEETLLAPSGGISQSKALSCLDRTSSGRVLRQRAPLRT